MASNYDGYVGVNKSGKVVQGKANPDDQARGAADAFNKDYESMRTSYDTYKKASEPSSASTEKSIRSGSESAIGRVQRTGREADSELKRESRPGQSKKW